MASSACSASSGSPVASRGTLTAMKVNGRGNVIRRATGMVERRRQAMVLWWRMMPGCLSLSPSLVLCCTLDPNRATSGRLLLGFSAANGSGWLAQSESPGARALKSNSQQPTDTHTHALDLRRVSSARPSPFEKRGGAILVSRLLWRFFGSDCRPISALTLASFCEKR